MQHPLWKFCLIQVIFPFNRFVRQSREVLFYLSLDLCVVYDNPGKSSTIFDLCVVYDNQGKSSSIFDLCVVYDNPGKSSSIFDLCVVQTQFCIFVAFWPNPDYVKYRTLWCHTIHVINKYNYGFSTCILFSCIEETTTLPQGGLEIPKTGPSPAERTRNRK